MIPLARKYFLNFLQPIKKGLRKRFSTLPVFLHKLTCTLFSVDINSQRHSNLPNLSQRTNAPNNKIHIFFQLYKSNKTSPLFSQNSAKYSFNLYPFTKKNQKTNNF